MNTSSQSNDNNPVVDLTVSLEGRLIKVTQRVAWMLHLLMQLGEKGITSREMPGVRMSHYVMLLRRDGIVIETIREGHSGPFAGRHGRYVLRSPVQVVAIVRAGDKRNAA